MNRLKTQPENRTEPFTWTRLLQRISSCTIELMNLCAGGPFLLVFPGLRISDWTLQKKIGHSTSKSIGPLEPYRVSDFSCINYKTPRCRKRIPNYARNQRLDPPKKRALTLYSRILGSPNHQFWDLMIRSVVLSSHKYIRIHHLKICFFPSHVWGLVCDRETHTWNNHGRKWLEMVGPYYIMLAMTRTLELNVWSSCSLIWFEFWRESNMG